MATFNLDLYFKNHKETTEIPAHQVAQVYVKTSTGHTYPDAKGVPFVSLQCQTYDELDYAVSSLEKELKQIRAKGKKKFGISSARCGNKSGNGSQYRPL